MFFHRHGKKRWKLGEFFLQFDRLIETIDSVCTDGSMAIGQEKVFNRWIDNIDENETKSIDR